MAPVAALRRTLDAALLGQDEAKLGLLLALIAREHAILEGAPGCGKSALAEALARGSGARTAAVHFHRDTRDADLRGDAVLQRRRTRSGEQLSYARIPGPLLRAEVALLDDVSRAPGEALAPLLRLLGERRDKGAALPLETAVATHIPAELDAYADPLEPTQLDRFAVQVRMRGLIYAHDWRAARALLDEPAPAQPAPLAAESRHACQDQAAALLLEPGVQDQLQALVRRLAEVARPEERARLSDRALGQQALRVMRAHALVRGAGSVQSADLAALRFLLGRRVSEDVHACFAELLAEVLQESAAGALPGGDSASAETGAAGTGGAGALRAAAPALHEESLARPRTHSDALPAADVDALLRALAGRLQRGQTDAVEHPGGAPRRMRRLRRLDEIADADPAEAVLFAAGQLAAPAVFQRERRDSSGALIMLRDVSASMEGRLSRWAGQVVAGIVRLGARHRMRLGYVEFNHDATRFSARGLFFHRGYPQLLGLAARRRAEGRTNYEAPLRLALEEFRSRPGGQRHILLLTDGVPVLGDPAVRRERVLARQLRVRIHTVFLGLGECPPVLDDISTETGGLRFVGVPSADGLKLRER